MSSTVLAVALGYQALLVCMSVRAWRQRPAGAAPRRARRPDDRWAAGLIQQRVVELSALWSGWMDHGWTLAGVGLAPAVPAPAAVLAGVGLYLPVLVLVGLAVRRWGAERDTVVACLGLWPRSRLGKAVTLLGLTINPFTEEVIARGLLVFALSSRTGPVAAVSLGLVLCLGTHLYQGARVLPFHALMYGLFVGLTFSPLGLWGAIGLHLAADLMPWLLLGDALERDRAARRVRLLRAQVARARGGSAGPQHQAS